MKLVRVTISPYLAVYEIHSEAGRVGFARKCKGFSYRGTDGWNRGVRLRDYRPTEWFAGETLGLQGVGHAHATRKRAVDSLLEQVKK